MTEKHIDYNYEKERVRAREVAQRHAGIEPEPTTPRGEPFKHMKCAKCPRVTTLTSSGMCVTCHTNDLYGRDTRARRNQ